MAPVFWDRKCVLLVDFMSPGATVNAAAYCDALTRLRRAIQNKRRGMLSRSVCLLHDNMRPHSALVTTALLEKFKWGARRSHDVVQKAGGRFLRLGDPEAGSKTS